MSKNQLPRSESGPPAARSGNPQSSKTNTAGDVTKKGEPTKGKKTDKKIEFQLPPLSVIGKKKELDFAEIRKKITRRSNPEGEDKKEIAAILKHLKDSKAKIKVHEFVGLVSKFTQDNGELMRKLLEADLATFRKTVTKVYETMTQDVSDVLVNEQIQTANHYQERYDMFNEKTLWMISEIFQMIPHFDFEKFAKDRDDYLNLVDPIPPLIIRGGQEIELQRRQEAFHRLQWLKIEGGRLAEENKRLENKLNELKMAHAREQVAAQLKAQIMNERKEDLEEQEHAKQEHLHKLEGILAKAAVRAEAYVRLEEDENTRLSKVKGDSGKKKIQKKPKRPEWCSLAAAELEAAAAKELATEETAAVDERKRHRLKEKEFTYSPTKAMSYRQDEPEGSGLQSAADMQERNIQQTTTVVQERRGRYRAPQDTWGGFQ